jgi:hypothetical protein
VVGSDVDPDPVGSASFCRIRIRFNQDKLYGFSENFSTVPYTVKKYCQDYIYHDTDENDKTM